MKEFGVKFSNRGMRDVFYRLKLSYTRPTYVLKKPSPEKQAESIKQFEDLKKLIGGMKMQFANKSEDTLNHLLLHDCVINRVEWVDSSLLFYMDWIEVLKTHPSNTTGKAKNSKNAVLIFEEAIEISCIYYDLTKAKEEGKRINKKIYNIPEDAEIMYTNIAEHCKDVEINDDNQHTENDVKIWTCSCQDDSKFKITYSTMWVCFNDLYEDSWLEYQPHH